MNFFSITYRKSFLRFRRRYMIVMNRKRISVIVLVILVGIFTFSYQATKDSQQESLPVTSTPVSGKVVVLDARSPEYLMKEHKVVMVQQKLKPT